METSNNFRTITLTALDLNDDINASVEINLCDIKKYPKSLLAQVYESINDDDEVKDVKFYTNDFTINMIRLFYETGIWQFNPYVLEFNQLKFFHIIEDNSGYIIKSLKFETMCDYLNLPNENFLAENEIENENDDDDDNDDKYFYDSSINPYYDENEKIYDDDQDNEDNEINEDLLIHGGCSSYDDEARYYYD